MFSIIIPAYNAEGCIARSISSVLRQKYGQFELIVVNDGSTDGTLEQIGKFSDERLRVISQENKGVSAARNAGIRSAKNPFICFLDADDEMLDSHLAVLSSAIGQYPDKMFFVTFSLTEMLDGTVKKQFEYHGDAAPFFVDDFLKFEFSNSLVKCFHTNSVCARKAAFDQYGYFEEGVSISEDEDMWNRIMLFEGKVVIPQETVLRHRDHSQLTRRPTVGAPYLFNRRIDGYLSDPSLSEEKKEELKKLYNIMELSSIRSLIVHGRKAEAAKRLRIIVRKYVPKKKYWETVVSFAVPSVILKRLLWAKNANYYKR